MCENRREGGSVCVKGREVEIESVRKRERGTKGETDTKKAIPASHTHKILGNRQ